MSYLELPFTDPNTHVLYASMVAKIEDAHVEYARGKASVDVTGYADLAAYTASPRAAAVRTWHVDLTPSEIQQLQNGFEALCYAIVQARSDFQSATLLPDPAP
jgi:predicted nicotinamide N-methyase